MDKLKEAGGWFVIALVVFLVLYGSLCGITREHKPVQLVTKILPSVNMIQLTGYFSYEEGHPQLVDPEDIVKIEGCGLYTRVWISKGLSDPTFIHVCERPAKIVELISKLNDSQP